MSQNTPNAPTRREQLSAYPETVCVGQYPGKSWQLELDADDLDADRLVEGPVLYVRCDIAHCSQTEAAKRGTVHQWRLTPDDEWVNAVDLVELEQVRNGYPNSETRILYTRPANVAALEARVKELEEKLKRAERWAEVAHQSCMGTGPKQALGGTLNGLHQFLRVALTREGGV